MRLLTFADVCITGQVYRICGICDRRGDFARFIATATSSARMHLGRGQRITADPPESSSSSSVGPEESGVQSSTDQSRTAFYGLFTSQSRQSFRDLLLGLILDEDLSCNTSSECLSRGSISEDEPIFRTKDWS
ncbi:hypothetical protein E4U22_003424 [Claviceps purpurea]|nr:hypothetical protein E4U22_003424 [Claviceps purpurea]